MGSKKKTKFGLFLRKVFKRANIGAFILSLIDLSALSEDQEVKDMLRELKKDVKNKRVVIDSENVKDFIYILGVLAEHDITDIAVVLREAEELAEEDED